MKRLKRRVLRRRKRRLYLRSGIIVSEGEGYRWIKWLKGNLSEKE